MSDRDPAPRTKPDGKSAIDSIHGRARGAASTVKVRRRRGGRDLATVLKNQPALKKQRAIVMEVAYQEYRARLRGGETITPEDFAAQFPSFQRSLNCYILAQKVVGEGDLAPGQKTIEWPEPGDLFLGFDLLSELGRGAIGRVFLASERALGERPVAIKVSLQGGHEAEILGRLRHANIVPVYSVKQDEETGLTAFWMPYLGRVALDKALDELFAERRPPLWAEEILKAVQPAADDAGLPEFPPPARLLRRGLYVEAVVHLAAQLADALRHAHIQGIAHRDLKPSNILMSPDGRPLLLDFNLSTDERNPTWKVGGTLPYMAPEHLATLCIAAGPAPDGSPRAGDDARSANGGRPPYYDPRSDLFALGIIIYELLTGKLPFGPVSGNRPLEETAAELRQRQTTAPRPIRELNPQVGKRLARLIDRCLAIDPDLRPQTAAELAAELRKELTLGRRAARRLVVHRRLVSGVLAAAGVLLLALILFFSLRPSYCVRQYEQGLVYFRAGNDASALERFNDSLRAAPREADVYSARANVYKRRGDFELALADYESAGQLSPAASVDACKAFCLNRLSQHRQAAVSYRRALDGGCDSAVVLNNLGYSWLRLHRLDDAETYLRRAVATDDSLQAAHHNLIAVFLQRAYEGTAIPAEAFVHARRALETGPASGELYRDLAALYALAAKEDAARAATAIDYAAKAVVSGVDPNFFKSDPAFLGFMEDPRFAKALVARGTPQNRPDAVLVIDPAPPASGARA